MRCRQRGPRRSRRRWRPCRARHRGSARRHARCRTGTHRQLQRPGRHHLDAHCERGTDGCPEIDPVSAGIAGHSPQCRRPGRTGDRDRHCLDWPTTCHLRHACAERRQQLLDRRSAADCGPRNASPVASRSHPQGAAADIDAERERLRSHRLTRADEAGLEAVAIAAIRHLALLDHLPGRVAAHGASKQHR